MFNPSTKRLVPIEDAVAVGVLVNRDLVTAPNVVRRREWSLVVDSPPDAVATEHLQACWRWILQILHHPEPPALVEAQADGLADQGFGQNQVDGQIIGDM